MLEISDIVNKNVTVYIWYLNMLLKHLICDNMCDNTPYMCPCFEMVPSNCNSQQLLIGMLPKMYFMMFPPI